MSHRTLVVRFLVEYETLIELEDGEHIQDAVYDVDIPETADVRYVDGTFDVIRATEEKTGEDVKWDEDEDT